MIKSISGKISSFLVYNKSIDSEDSEICSYGLEILISSLINSLIILALGLMLGKLTQTIVFLLCYCSIRRCAGGYHSNTHRNCIFSFVCMYLITIIITCNIDSIHLKPAILLIGILNWISIYMLVPVEHENNPLDNIEKVKHKKSARIRVTVVLISMIICLSLYSLYEYGLYCLLSLCWVNFMLILQVLKIRRKTKMNKFLKHSTKYIGSLAIFTAFLSAKSACIWYNHQPEMPKNLKSRIKQ